MTKRKIVIGDPHGCLKEFDALLAKVKFSPAKDELVVAGDIFDRGPDSLGILRRVKELDGVSVLGNHDEKHLRYAAHRARKRLDPNYKIPMRPFHGLREEIQNSLTEEDLIFLRRAPLSYQLDEKWVVVHGGLERLPFYKQGKAVLRVRYLDKTTGLHKKLPGSWEKPPDSVYWADDWEGPESVIYGHNVHSFTDPKVTKVGNIYTMGIDTGAVFGGRLTAAIIENGNFIGFEQIQVEKAYKEMTKNSHKE